MARERIRGRLDQFQLSIQRECEGLLVFLPFIPSSLRGLTPAFVKEEVFEFFEVWRTLQTSR